MGKKNTVSEFINEHHKQQSDVRRLPELLTECLTAPCPPPKVTDWADCLSAEAAYNDLNYHISSTCSRKIKVNQPDVNFEVPEQK